MTSSPKRQRTETESSDSTPQNLTLLLIELNEDSSFYQYLVTFQDETQLNMFSNLHRALIDQKKPTMFLTYLLNPDEDDEDMNWTPETPDKPKFDEFNFTWSDTMKFFCDVVGFGGLKVQFIDKRVLKFEKISQKRHLEEFDGKIYGVRIVHSWH